MAQNYSKITMTLKPETITALDKLSKKKGISKSAVGRLILQDGCNHYKKEWGVK